MSYKDRFVSIMQSCPEQQVCGGNCHTGKRNESTHQPSGSRAKMYFHWDRELLEFPRCDTAVIMG